MSHVEFDWEDMSREETILAQTVETFFEDGDMQTWALLLDAVELRIEHNRDELESYNRGTSVYYEVITLRTEPAALAKFTPELRQRVTERLQEVARGNDVPAVRYVEFERRLPIVAKAWREQQEERLRGERLTNQARRVRDDPAYPREDDFTFRSREEILVYRALKRAQVAGSQRNAGFAIFPLPSGLLPIGSTWEPDFVIALNKRMGILEVDGPQHGKRYAADVSRDHQWREAGVALVDRILVEDTKNENVLDQRVRAFLRQLSQA